MHNMKAMVMVDFGDLANFIMSKEEISWNAVHDKLFGNYDNPMLEAMVIEREYINEWIEDEWVINYIIAFMDHHELDEFYWVAR